MKFTKNCLQLFPAKQKIEWQGETVETDNEWLINRFTSYKDLKKNDPQRRQILAEIYERLDAVEQKIIELETAIAQNARRTKKNKNLPKFSNAKNTPNRKRRMKARSKSVSTIYEMAQRFVSRTRNSNADRPDRISERFRFFCKF